MPRRHLQLQITIVLYYTYDTRVYRVGVGTTAAVLIEYIHTYTPVSTMLAECTAVPTSQSAMTPVTTTEVGLGTAVQGTHPL